MGERIDEGEISPDELVESDSGVVPQTTRSRRRDPLIGATLDGRYEVLRLIARGGMGRIYSAEQSALGRRVALKVMDLGYAEDLDPDFQKRFFLEASTCAQLSHPNTIRVFDYGADGDICYIAMELIEGKTLLQAIHDSAPFPSKRVMHIARQICGSLSEAHGKGIIHRDLKPSNVLLTQHGEEKDFAKVLDFGLVKLLRDDAQEITRSGLFLGSPNYMSPEQIRATNVDQRSDLYSLGVILFMALTGRSPFKRNTSINVLLAQLEEPPPMLRDVAPDTDASAALQWTVMTCLEKDANHRFGSVDELNKALRACQAQEAGEFDAPLHLRLEAGSVVVSTVPPGIDPMGAHGLRSQPRPGSQDPTLETAGPSGFPRPTFGYTPSIGSQQSGVGWNATSSMTPPGPASLRVDPPPPRGSGPAHVPSGPSLAPQPPPRVRTPMDEMPTPVTGGPPPRPPTALPQEVPSEPKRRKRAPPPPPPGFWEKYGVLTLSLVALLLAIAAVGLLIDPASDAVPNGAQTPLPDGEVPVTLASDPPGASVLKDGALLGTTPLDLLMPPGASWELTLAAEGRAARTVVVEAGTPSETVQLELASDTPPDLAPPRPTGGHDAPRTGDDPAPDGPPSASRPRHLRSDRWSLHEPVRAHPTRARAPRAHARRGPGAHARTHARAHARAHTEEDARGRRPGPVGRLIARRRAQAGSLLDFGAMRPLSAALALALALSPLTAATPAFAQSDTDARARELFENGARLYDEGLYNEAIAAWRAAYQLSPDKALLLYNMANAYERLGRYQEALDNLNRYRAVAPSEERETLERRMRAIERRIEELKERASSAPEGDPLLDASQSRMTVSTSSTSTAGTGAGPHPAGIALIAGGGVGLAVGGVLGGLALQQRASARALCIDVASGGTLCPSEAKAHIDQDRSLSLGGDIAMIAGGVALGAGVIILVVDATSGGAKTSALRVLPSAGPGGAAVTLSGRF
jgi:serine/threonine protein kinase